MDQASPDLAQFIRAEIARRGPVPFRCFMEQALYHPEYGWYSAGRSALGRKGDFLTNVTVGPLYGRLMAREFTLLRERLGRPRDFVIAEQGAYDGAFAKDVLAALPEFDPKWNHGLRYRIIEPFPVLEARQRETLKSIAQVEWRKDLESLEPFEGVHFSNELIDSFPIHLVARRGQDWIERYVAIEEEQFLFQDGPLSDPRLPDHLAPLGADFPDGYQTEINLAAGDWIRALSSKLLRGCILAVDYGYPRSEYYKPGRTSGTLSSYAKHHRVEDPLAAPGGSDLTAHVDFTALAEAAVAAGLDLAGFTDQHHFLVGVTADSPEIVGADPAALRQFKTLMHPELMGARFQAIAFTRGMELPLPGFQFAREAWKRL